MPDTDNAGAGQQQQQQGDGGQQQQQQGDGGQQQQQQGDGGQQQQQQGGANQRGQGPSGVYLPENLPSHLAGANDRDTIDKLFGAYQGAREALSKHGSVPASADEYQIHVDDRTSKFVGDLSADPVIGIARLAAHKHGLTSEQLNGFINDVLFQSYDGGIVDQPIDKDAELTKLEPRHEADPQKARAAAIQRQETALTFVEGLKLRKVLDDNQSAMLGALTVTADGVQMLENLAKFSAGHGIQAGVGAGAGARTKEEISRDMQSVKYDTQSPEHDPAFRRRVDAEWAALFTG